MADVSMPAPHRALGAAACALVWLAPSLPAQDLISEIRSLLAAS